MNHGKMVRMTITTRRAHQRNPQLMKVTRKGSWGNSLFSVSANPSPRYQSFQLGLIRDDPDADATAAKRPGLRQHV